MDVDMVEDTILAIRLLEGDFARCEAITSAIIPRPGYAGDTGKAPGDGGGTRPDYAVGREKAEGKASKNFNDRSRRGQ
jgi:hypothetical protein